jgi:DNA polymerase III epsilon subunit-like protein
MVLPEFVRFLGDPATTLLLAHNAAFDTRFLGHELERAGLARPAHAVVDTLALARRRLPNLPDHRLDSLTWRLKLNGGEQHRALADSLRVKDLWQRLEGPAEPSDALVMYPIFDPGQTVSVPLGWEALDAAIARGLRIRLEYTGGSRGDAPREVTPRAFVHRGGIPYLIAYCHIDAFEKSFRLDRVRRFEIVTETP